MAGESAKGICATRSFHGSRATAQLLEYRPVAVLVPDIVALEHGTALRFGLGQIQFGALFDYEAKDATDICLLSGGSRVITNVAPLADEMLVPATYRAVGPCDRA